MWNICNRVPQPLATSQKSRSTSTKTSGTQVERIWNSPPPVPLLFQMRSTKKYGGGTPQSLATSQKSPAVPLVPRKNNIPPYLLVSAPSSPCVGFSAGGRGNTPPRQKKQKRGPVREISGNNLFQKVHTEQSPESPFLPSSAGASRACGCPPPAFDYRAEARTHFSNEKKRRNVK